MCEINKELIQLRSTSFNSHKDHYILTFFDRLGEIKRERKVQRCWIKSSPWGRFLFGVISGSMTKCESEVSSGKQIGRNGDSDDLVPTRLAVVVVDDGVVSWRRWTSPGHASGQTIFDKFSLSVANLDGGFDVPILAFVESEICGGETYKWFFSTVMNFCEKFFFLATNVFCCRGLILSLFRLPI